MAEERNRYKKALSARVREEAEAEKKQEELRKRYGLSGDVSVTGTEPSGAAASLLSAVLKILMAVLAFVFLLVLLDPEMRRLFFEMPLFDFVRGFS